MAIETPGTLTRKAVEPSESKNGREVEARKTGPTRILIVEDNSDDEALLMRQLQKARMDQHICVIGDGKRAVEFLTNVNFPSHDLVAMFLDLDLPSMNGLQLLEIIRAHDRIRHLHVIVMTSSNAPEILEKCRTLGVSSYLPKPITFTAFTKAIADSFHSPRPSTGFTKALDE